MRRSVVLMLAAALLLLSPAATASEQTTHCGVSTTLHEADAGCLKSGSQTNGYITAHADHTYTIRPACEIGGLALCDKPAQCEVDGHPGWLYNVYEDNRPDPLDWQACLTRQETHHLGGLTPGAVRHAFERLTWPASTLVVQPPKGRTLVNFDTNFYTTNTHPTTRTVTLVGQRVTIEASPTAYTWHFGAAGADRTTTDPGAAYPDLRVTYRYLRVGTVHPSVDTTYSGRYRVGSGRWRTIPATLTVHGAAVDLRVVSATPHLVGY
jgi:hypothetical protein